METKTLDFAGLNQTLLSDAEGLLMQWLPGGKQKGREWVCADLAGNPDGHSMSTNIDTGRWADFATDQKGGDLISLYATIRGIGQGDAFKELADGVGFTRTMTSPPPPKQKEDEFQLGLPPEDAPKPDIPGSPSSEYVYRDSGGRPIFYVHRYDINGEKTYVPRTWSLSLGSWVKKRFPRPTPIYGMDILEKKPNAPVMIVEGEKAADAGRLLCGNLYAVISWHGGTKSWKYVDWSPIKDRKVILWPDADEPGIKCMEDLACELPNDNVKLIDPVDKSDGWDAADARSEGWTWERLVAWAKPLARVVKSKGEPEPEANPDNEEEKKSYASAYSIWQELGVEVGRNGGPIRNLLNAHRAIANWPALSDHIWYDEFHDKVFTTFFGGAAQEWKDDDTLAITRYMQDELRLPFGDDLIFKAIRLHARTCVRNEPMDYLNTLEWDGIERVPYVFADAFGAESNVYTMTASKNFWVGMAARIARPGCKLDTMVILEGKQGALKSSALAEIGGKWYAEATESVNSKDFYLTFRGKMLLEIGEMDAFNKADTTRIKQIISNPCDTYRRPYGRMAEDFPRRCIFAGTTNESHYLKDTTGGRRFWPIECKSIDLSYLRANRDQLFAEAHHLFKQGTTWWEMPEEQTKKEQEARRQTDSWEDLIRNWIKEQPPGMEPTTHKIINDCLQIDPSKQEHRHSVRIGKAMRSLGYKAAVRWNKDENKAQRVYVREGELE